LRACRTGQRRAAVRGLSVAIRTRRQAPAPLDPRRLAAAAVAAALGACWRGRPRTLPAVDALARQAARQPAPQPRAGGDGDAVRAWLAAGAIPAALVAVGAVDAAARAAGDGNDRAARQARRAPAARAPAASRARG